MKPATGFLYQPATPGEKARIGVFVMQFGSDDRSARGVPNYPPVDCR